MDFGKKLKKKSNKKNKTMIAHLLTPLRTKEKETIAINVVIPFETLDLSIVLDNSNGCRQECFRDDIRIYCSKSESRVDLTKEILGVSAQYGTDTLKFVEIINKVAKADLVRISANDLPQRIHSFLEKYAVLNPNKQDEDDNKYTSPDAHQLEACADLLKIGYIPSQCWSEWGSGGYKRMFKGQDGRYEHDSLVKEVYAIINKK